MVVLAEMVALAVLAEMVGNAAVSDQRLKSDITYLGKTNSGIKLYSFKYLCSDQVFVGVMDQDLLANSEWKNAVITGVNGFTQ